MKKVLIFVFILFFGGSVNAQPFQPVQPAQPKTFDQVWQEVQRLNSGRFANIDSIQIGASVLFPALVGNGTAVFAADYPENGTHDCMYRMSLKYYNGQLKVQPVVNKDVVPEIVKETEVKKNGLNWPLILITIGLVLLVAAIVSAIRYYKENRSNINRRPVVAGGLSDNPLEAAAQVSALTGSRVIKSERGRLIGNVPAKVTMNFSDGTKRVKLISGEEYFRITESSGTIRYARQSCGNLVSGSISDLPSGWTFVPSTQENASWTEPAPAPVVIADEVKPANVVEQVSAPVIISDETKPVLLPAVAELGKNDLKGYDVAKILRAAGKMKSVPSSIVVNSDGLTIKFKEDGVA